MPKSSININISVESAAPFFNKSSIKNLILETAKKFKLKNVDVNIEIVGDKQIARLNKKFLNKKSVTDVLSFDISDSQSRIFDIVVNAQMAQRQAKSRKHSPRAELALYILHGLLHNLGFNDTTARSAAKMHKTEDDILQKHGFGVVYGDHLSF